MSLKIKLYNKKSKSYENAIDFVNIGIIEISPDKKNSKIATIKLVEKYKNIFEIHVVGEQLELF